MLHAWPSPRKHLHVVHGKIGIGRQHPVAHAHYQALFPKYHHDAGCREQEVSLAWSVLKGRLALSAARPVLRTPHSLLGMNSSRKVSAAAHQMLYHAPPCGPTTAVTLVWKNVAMDATVGKSFCANG